MSQDRVALVTNPALPAKCVICGFNANGRRQFLDFGVSLDYYGAILICENCLIEASHSLETPVAEAEGRVKELEAELEVVTDERDRLKFVFSGLFNTGIDFGLLKPEELENSESNSTEASGELTEQVAIGGPQNVLEPPD